MTRSVYNLAENILINLLRMTKCEHSKIKKYILTYISEREELVMTFESVKYEVKRFKSYKGKKSRNTAEENTIRRDQNN